MMSESTGRPIFSWSPLTVMSIHPITDLMSRVTNKWNVYSVAPKLISAKLDTPVTETFTGPGNELWSPTVPLRLPDEPVPATLPEGLGWLENAELNPPENYRKYNLPKDPNELDDLFNPEILNPDAMMARVRYWDKVLPANEAYFPMGIHHYAFREVMYRFIPSGRYHTILWYRLREVRRWVGNHRTWKEARDAYGSPEKQINIQKYIPPRILYVIFALGTPIKGADMYHFSFSAEIALLIKGTHLHWMIPNLRSQFDDGQEDWEESRDFWAGHPEYEDALDDRRAF